ncbi:MAG: T9SS type A sorting domain-containing protein, partial [Bacteroidales bacterium]|nr:T9SS type A sorting domain-containing protein [Bacteroidales bacterium]
DEMVDPEVEFSYTVAAVYGGDESQPTAPFMITVPTPVDLEALGLEGVADIPNENDVTLTWDEPEACLAPDSYSIYRDGSMIADGVTDLTYVDGALNAGFYEYYVVAVYYFADSDPSDPTYVLITGIEDYDASLFQIFPNPATDLVNVKTPVEMTTISVLNNAGQIVVDEAVNTMNYQIDVSQFESGIYYIKLETDEGSIVRKIAVE